MYNSSEADVLFKRLDLELMENIDSQYFSEPREFRFDCMIPSKIEQVCLTFSLKIIQVAQRGFRGPGAKG